MRFYYRLKSSGEVLGAAMSSAQGPAWISAYAANLGIDAEDIEQFESAEDPRPANPRTEPEPPKKPSPQEERDAAIRAATTVEALKQAILGERSRDRTRG